MCRQRADQLLFKLKLTQSRHQAKDLIERKLVFYKNKQIKKPAERIPCNASADDFIIQNQIYVSRAAEKLIFAIKHFHINVKNKICLDVGSSTGGFTQVLILNDAQKVYSVEVGTNQMHKSLHNNSKVILLEKTDIKKLDKNKMPECAEFFCIDVSFVSVLNIIKNVLSFTSKNAEGIILFKPQFEVGKYFVNNQGKADEAKTKEVFQNFIQNIQKYFHKIEYIPSPIKGMRSKNQEILVYCKLQRK